MSPPPPETGDQRRRRRRGRPPLAAAEAYSEAPVSMPARDAPRSRRHLQNRWYAHRVAVWVAGDPALTWLHDVAGGTVRLTALAELGRVDLEHGPAVARALALKICERARASTAGRRLTTAAAAAWIRRWRLEQRGGSRRGGTPRRAAAVDPAAVLAARLRETIARFRAERPPGAVTDEALAAALHDVGSTLVLVDRGLTRHDAG